MEMSGERRISAGRDTVWAALNDPDVLAAAIPGCQSLEKVSDTELTATVQSKVGPVKANFTGKVTLSDIVPPLSYKISGEGKGGVAGFAKGGADVRLAEDGDETVLTYRAKAQVGGKLAQLGSRLLDSTAKKMADQFFDTFSEIVGTDETEAPGDNFVAGKHQVETTAGPQSRGGIFGNPIAWIAAAAVAVGIVYLLMG